MSKTSLTLLAGVLLATSAPGVAEVSGHIHEQKLRIAIDDGTEHGQVFVELNDGDAIDVDSMQLGETRSVVDENGRAVLVTRTEHGLELDVDGKKIDVPGFSTLSDAAWTTDVHENVFVDVASSVSIEHGGTANEVTIISGSRIDDATREGIRSLLSASGHDGDVVFVDGHDTIALEGVPGAMRADRTHRLIKVISREVSETN